MENSSIQEVYGERRP